MGQLVARKDFYEIGWSLSRPDAILFVLRTGIPWEGVFALTPRMFN
jgi:hypothetical protein